MSFAATWMDPEGNMLNEISQRDKYRMISLFMWDLKKQYK